jgi:hypothetical protein
MAISQVFTDLAEYSRYHLELSKITATILDPTPTSGAAITVALVRLDGYGAVCSKTFTEASETQYQVTFDLNRDTYDTQNIYRAKQGDYIVRVQDDIGNILAESKDFAISIVPVAEIKNTWATGVTFMNYEVILPKVQPRVVTGVEVIEVPLTHYKGPFPLKYRALDKSLSWNNGDYVPVEGLQPQQILLVDKSGQDYIMTQVNPLLLPTADKTEVLIIDNNKLSDRDMIKQVRLATQWVQQRIIAKVEPEIVSTESLDFSDEIAVPGTYYRPTNFNKWMSFQLPYTNILNIEKITGWFNTSQSAFVPREWYTWHEKTGIIELVPSSASEVTWQFYNGVFVMAYLLNFPSIPSFWHYTMTCGLRDLNNERAVVREAIAKKAVFELLNSAGSAYRAGYASQSVGRDGISQSEGYTSSATFGTYGGHFTSYKEWLDKEIPRMKKRFNGIVFSSI